MVDVCNSVEIVLVFGLKVMIFLFGLMCCVVSKLKKLMFVLMLMIM